MSEAKFTWFTSEFSAHFCFSDFSEIGLISGPKNHVLILIVVDEMTAPNELDVPEELLPRLDVYANDGHGCYHYQ